MASLAKGSAAAAAAPGNGDDDRTGGSLRQEDLQAARHALSALPAGAVRARLEESLAELTTTAARDSVAAGRLVPGPVGVREALAAASSAVSSGEDAVCLAVHLSLLQLGWTAKSATDGGAEDTAAAVAAAAPVGIKRLLPPGWAGVTGGAWKSHYATTSGQAVTVTGIRMDGQIIIHATSAAAADASGTADAAADTCSTEIALQDVCPAAGTWVPSLSAIEALQVTLGASVGKVGASAVKSHKRRSAKADGASSKQKTSGLRADPRPGQQGRRGGSGGPMVDWGSRRGGRGGMGGVYGGGRPGSFGFDDDLNPFGSGQGGSLLGPGHPGFGGGGGMPRRGGGGRFGGGGMMPGVPPGARFDPFGPGVPGGGGGRGGHPGMGGPTPDHLRPPSMGGGDGPPSWMYQ